MSYEEKIQCLLRRALIYSEGCEDDFKRRQIVIENINSVLDIFSYSELCDCNCECRDRFKNLS